MKMKSVTDRIDPNALTSWLGPAYDELTTAQRDEFFATAARVITGNDAADEAADEAALIAELERLTT